MKIQSPTGQTVSSMDEWADVFSTPKKKVHWKEHRSAHALASFVLQRNGLEKIRQRTSTALNEDLQFKSAIIEQEVRFDSFGHGREHDLGIYGLTDSGKSIFIGVEAKVDEPFGLSIQEAYLNAKMKELSGMRTNAPERIERLLKLHFQKVDRAKFNLRYQLLYATTGTTAVKADLSVLFIAVFNTPLYDDVVGAGNYRDYLEFMAHLEAEKIKPDIQGPDIRLASIGDSDLVCIYENFN